MSPPCYPFQFFLAFILLATESQSNRHPRVLSIRVGEIFLCLILINSPTRFARRGIRTVSYDVNKRIKATWCHYIQKKTCFGTNKVLDVKLLVWFFLKLGSNRSSFILLILIIFTVHSFNTIHTSQGRVDLTWVHSRASSLLLLTVNPTYSIHPSWVRVET